MTGTIVLGIRLESITCYSCGTVFAVTDSLARKLHDTGSTFYCPNGHSQHFTKTTQQKLEDALEQVKRERERANARVNAYRDQADATERSNRALRGSNTKLRKRIAAGVCPCCQRSFQNLAQHMAGQHPDYAESDPA